MSPISDKLFGPSPLALEAIYAPVREEMDACAAMIHATLKGANPAVQGMADQITANLGKRVRSALVLLAHRAASQGRPEAPDGRRQALVLAEAVELIHNATLVHDDIIDNSALRRGAKTLNYSWGNETAVLMGDLIFARVFTRLALNVPPAIMAAVSDATQYLVDGEIQEVRSRFLVTLGEAEYFQIVGNKTASLIAACCQAGGMAAGAPEAEIRALMAYGHKVGVAFQVADDLLDLEGDAAALGKPHGHDLLEGKMTLPAILALARASRSERAMIQEILLEDPIQPAQLDRVVEFVRAQGGLDMARARARTMVDEARGALAALPKSPARDSLEALARYFVERDH